MSTAAAAWSALGIGKTTFYKKLKEHGLIDEIIPEPLGGGHRDPDSVARSLRAALLKALDEVRDTIRSYTAKHGEIDARNLRDLIGERFDSFIVGFDEIA